MIWSRMKLGTNTVTGPSWRTTDIMKLAQLNSLVSYNSYKLFGIKPIHVHPMVILPIAPGRRKYDVF